MSCMLCDNTRFPLFMHTKFLNAAVLASLARQTSPCESEPTEHVKNSNQLLAGQLGINRSTARTIVSVAMRQDVPDQIGNKLREESKSTSFFYQRWTSGTISRQTSLISYSHLIRVCHGLFFQWKTCNRLQSTGFVRTIRRSGNAMQPGSLSLATTVLVSSTSMRRI